MKERPTPETDAQVTTFTSISKYKKRFECSTGKVSAEFARRLERERDEARLLAIWAAARLSAHLDPVKYHGTASRLRTLCHRHTWLNCPENYPEE